MRTLFIAVFVIFAAQVSAQMTLVSRIDARQQARPSYALGVVHPAIEVWGLGLPDNPDIEIGKLFPVKTPKDTTLLLGGYLVNWPNSNQYFVLPWGYGQVRHGNLKGAMQIAYYSGLNTSTSILFTDETSVTYETRKGLDLGLAASCWQQSGACVPLRFGPVVKATLSKSVSLSARALLLGGRASDSYRLEVTTTF